jgi:hypothetical protein
MVGGASSKVILVSEITLSFRFAARHCLSFDFDETSLNSK